MKYLPNTRNLQSVVCSVGAINCIYQKQGTNLYQLARSYSPCVARRRKEYIAFSKQTTDCKSAVAEVWDKVIDWFK